MIMISDHQILIIYKFQSISPTLVFITKIYIRYFKELLRYI